LFIKIVRLRTLRDAISLSKVIWQWIVFANGVPSPKHPKTGSKLTSMTRKAYEGKDITVTFDLDVCQHAGRCVRGVPEVFNTQLKPWIEPDNAPAEKIAAVIDTCPSGALEYQLHPTT
jgi:uncharacterized Fe-S cluster protein YjdI